MSMILKNIKASLLFVGVWLLTLGGGILIGKHCLPPTEIASEPPTGGSLNQTSNDPLVVEVSEVLVMDDVHNIPYQKKIWKLIQQLVAGDLYGEKREEAISLAQEYGAKCREAKV